MKLAMNLAKLKFWNWWKTSQPQRVGIYGGKFDPPHVGHLMCAEMTREAFHLDKVLFVTIEMRHAPFYGWIKDLAAPDPLTILTGFGLFSWHVPDFLHFFNIGLWPIIMGVTMFLPEGDRYSMNKSEIHSKLAILALDASQGSDLEAGAHAHLRVGRCRRRPFGLVMLEPELAGTLAIGRQVRLGQHFLLFSLEPAT